MMGDWVLTRCIWEKREKKGYRYGLVLIYAMQINKIALLRTRFFFVCFVVFCFNRNIEGLGMAGPGVRFPHSFQLLLDIGKLSFVLPPLCIISDTHTPLLFDCMCVVPKVLFSVYSSKMTGFIICHKIGVVVSGHTLTIWEAEA